MKTYKSKQYAKILPDGSVDIITSVLKTPTRNYYYPSEALCAAFGYYPVDLIGDDTEEEGYKIFDDGIKVVEKDGKKIAQRTVRKLQIVDDGPQPGPGQEVKRDKWKEIKGKWVHVYKYRSASRHITPTKFPEEPVPSKKEEPVAEAAPEEVAPTPEPEPVPAAEVAEPVPEEVPAATEEPVVEETAAPSEEQPMEEPAPEAPADEAVPTEEQPPAEEQPAESPSEELN